MLRHITAGLLALRGLVLGTLPFCVLQPLTDGRLLRRCPFCVLLGFFQFLTASAIVDNAVDHAVVILQRHFRRAERIVLFRLFRCHGKWKSDIPLTDEKGNPLLQKNGKPMFRASYSILQDELFNYMTEQGFKGFQRGEYGSTAEHLTSLQYQIKQDKERLEKLQQRIQKEQVKYEPARHKYKETNRNL